MKISSLPASGAVSMADSHSAHEPVFAGFHHAVSSFFLKLDQMGMAIALGQAGDLDGAKALREQILKASSKD